VLLLTIVFPHYQSFNQPIYGFIEVDAGKLKNVADFSKFFDIKVSHTLLPIYDSIKMYWILRE
jgi:hypothetical protein